MKKNTNNVDTSIRDTMIARYEKRWQYEIADMRKREAIVESVPAINNIIYVDFVSRKVVGR